MPSGTGRWTTTGRPRVADKETRHRAPSGTVPRDFTGREFHKFNTRKGEGPGPNATNATPEPAGDGRNQGGFSSDSRTARPQSGSTRLGRSAGSRVAVRLAKLGRPSRP